MSMEIAEQHFDVGIIQPGYLPWLGYFDLVAMSNVFVIYDDVQFDRGGWRNRNRLLSLKGPEWITAPVLHKGHLGASLRETRLVSNNWQTKHLQMIRTLYGKAPYFEWVFPQLLNYLDPTYEWLLDLCLKGHHIFCNLLDLKVPLKLSSELGFAGIGRTERLVAICKFLNATRYVACDASINYMNQQLWDEEKIKIVYQNYPHPTYPQWSATFTSHLSIVDALMFMGPGVRAHLGISHSKSTLNA